MRIINSSYKNREKELKLRYNKIKVYIKILDKLKKKPNSQKNYLVKNNIYFLEKKIERIKKFI